MDRISAMETRPNIEAIWIHQQKSNSKVSYNCFKIHDFTVLWGGIKGRDGHHTQLLEQNLLTFIITTLVANKGFSNNFVQCYVQTHKTQTRVFIFAKFI